MKLFGITGGIGMGKSTAGDFLLSLGLPVLDTDNIAREVVLPGTVAWEEIAETFGRKVIQTSGELDRGELAKVVFNDEAALKKLEGILHPRIRIVWQEAVKKWKGEGKRFGFVIIPLLYETKAAESFDSIICLACSRVTQEQRLAKRGWEPRHIERRLAAQWPVEKKMAAAQFVVWTDTTVEAHQRQLKRILDRAA